MACLSLVDRILPAFRDNCFAIAVFLDFRACFDTLSRTILTDKLRTQRTSPWTHQVSQYVDYQNHSSEILNQDMGVIQGSKNGPLMFDLYSNDINMICGQKENILFADDTSLTYTDKNFESLIHRVNQRLSIILEWCNTNKMSINPSKSEFCILTNKSIDFEPVITLGDERIGRRKTVKYLGLHLDDNLKFNSHIDQLKKKLSRLAGVSYRLRKYFNLGASKKFYFACTYSIITYCIAVYGGDCHLIAGKNSSRSMKK